MWPPRRQRTKLPSFERTTIKAHVLAHVARSRRRRVPGRDAPIDLPLPAPAALPRGSQTTPRLAGESAPADAAPSLSALAAHPIEDLASSLTLDEQCLSNPGAGEPALEVEPRSRRVHADPALHPPAAHSPALQSIDARPATGELGEHPPPAAPDSAMPPLYSGIAPYRHSEALAPPFDFGGAQDPVFALSSARAPVFGAAPAVPVAPLERRAARALHPKARTAGHVRRRPQVRIVTLAVFLLLGSWWAAAYWQAWAALSMTERCLAAWERLAPSDDAEPGES
jgi:hypothetical protein